MPVTLYAVFNTLSKVEGVKTLQFSGGEPHVAIADGVFPGTNYLIDARLGTPADFMLMLAMADAVRRSRPKSLSLFAPYFPGGRQDHPEPGTPFTAKIYADLVNAEGFDNVFIVDPHSAVTPALLNRCVVFTAADVSVGYLAVQNDYQAAIAPDAGAVKRAMAVAGPLDLPVFVGQKQRLQSDGRITGYEINMPQPLLPPKVLVIDDICDGGATFLMLAGAFAAEKDLYVTHGIFSKGTSELLKHYRRIITTDSFPRACGGNYVNNDRVSEIKLMPHFTRLICQRINA